jgi:DNA-binding NarL/FixJ family response regulator
MSERVLRVVIADDHFLVREGTRRLLEESGEVETLASVGTAEELIDAVERLNPNAVLTDIRMPPTHHMEGIEAAHRLRVEHPEVGVVVLSQFADEAYAFELLKHGAEGRAYLLKDRVGDLAERLRALREVVAGRSVIDPRIVEALVGRRARVAESGIAQLTPRELDVLREMAQGRSNGGIAEALHLSESAIEKHAGAIFIKLGLAAEPLVHRRVSAVLRFMRDGAPD